MCRVKTVLHINLSLLTTSTGATNWANVPLAALVNLTIHTLQRGSMGIAKKITTIQRIAALTITGAMRSTATDLLEVHTNLLPVTLLLQNTCHRAIVRLTALPESHPLHPHVRRAARRFVSSHRSSLHRLTHHFAINPDDIESLIPARRPPHSTNPYSIHIAPDKNQAIEEYEQLTDRIQVFSDGSGHNGHIGAAAVLFRAGNSPRVLRYHLGTEEEHTVFEAEEVGLMLAAKLILS